MFSEEIRKIKTNVLCLNSLRWTTYGSFFRIAQGPKFSMFSTQICHLICCEKQFDHSYQLYWLLITLIKLRGELSYKRADFWEEEWSDFYGWLLGKIM